MAVPRAARIPAGVNSDGPRALAIRNECAWQTALLSPLWVRGESQAQGAPGQTSEPCSRDRTSSETSQVMSRFGAFNTMSVRRPRLSQSPQIEKIL